MRKKLKKESPNTKFLQKINEIMAKSDIEVLKSFENYLKENKKNVIKVGPYYRDLNQNALLKNICNKCNQEIKERALFNSVYVGCLC